VQVYDVTHFAPDHPGGVAILAYGGRDASDVFAAFHAAHTWSLLPKYCIGEVQVSFFVLPRIARKNTGYRILDKNVRLCAYGCVRRPSTSRLLRTTFQPNHRLLWPRISHLAVAVELIYMFMQICIAVSTQKWQYCIAGKGRRSHASEFSQNPYTDASCRPV
jgi:Cytochrome b5-like Heme/Steroid binding domain